MTTEPDADLVAATDIAVCPACGALPCDWTQRPITPTDRQMLDAVLGRLATLQGWTLTDYSEFLQRLIAWADGRRDAAMEIERQCSVEVIATRDAQIDGLTEALTENAECLRLLDTDSRIQLPDGDLWTRVSNARQQARAALEPAAEGV